MEAEQGYKVSKLAPSDTLCPARLKHLPKHSVTHRVPALQITKPMGDTSHLNHL